MAYMALYRKWRSQTFDEIVGQEAVVTALRNQILYNRVGHAYLFCGTRGTGKTSMAKIFARAVNCLNPQNGNPCNECELCRDSESGFNLIEIDAASNNGVDNIREIRDEVRYTPAKGKYRVYIIDEVHMLSTGAFNALLKTLEEPPEHVIFILATTEPHKVLPTIVSRCQRYDFKRFTATEIFLHLQEIALAEGFRITDDALRYIARAADGGMRDALSILEQCISFYVDRSIGLQEVLEVLGVSGEDEYTRLTEALAARRTTDALNLIGEVFMAGKDITAFTTGLIGHMRGLLMMKAMGMAGAAILELGEEEARNLNEQASRIPVEQLTYFIEQLTDLESRMKYASEKRVLLEVTVIRLCRLASETGDKALEARIGAVEKKIEEGIVVRQDPQPAPKEEKQDPQPKPVEKPAAVPQPVQAKPAPENLSRVIDSWPSIRKNIARKSRALYTLNMMEIAPGSGPDELVLSSPNAIYLEQLEARNGEKLRFIEACVLEETGVKVRMMTTGNTASSAPAEEDDDLDEILSTIHGEISYE